MKSQRDRVLDALTDILNREAIRLREEGINFSHIGELKAYLEEYLE